MGASTQEDFDSVTSVVADVDKMTDPQLNLVLAEGGSEPGKNRFGDKQTKDNPLLTLTRYRIYQSTAKTRFKEGLIKKQNKLDHDTYFVSGPFVSKSHEVTFPKQGLEQLPLWQLSRSQTAKQPNQMQESIRPKGIQTIHFGLAVKTGHILGLLF